MVLIVFIRLPFAQTSMTLRADANEERIQDVTISKHRTSNESRHPATNFFEDGAKLLANLI
jgi:hypothetical protein